MTVVKEHAFGATLEPLERYRPLIDDWDAFAAVQERPLAPTIWTNTLRATPDELCAYLERDGVAAEALPWCPGAFRLPEGTPPTGSLAHALGLYHVQEEVALLPVVLLDPRPGDAVLDLCAAPGNKTVQAAVRMKDRGTLVANDTNPRRIGLIVQSLERLGVTIGAVLAYDAGNLPRDVGVYDRVLADVPCSCEGTARKNPEVLSRQTSRRPTSAQLAILRKAVQRCRPGGRIVYSTCTYAPEENELVVDEVLREAPGTLRLLPASVAGFSTRPGIAEWQGRRLHDEMDRCLRVWPHHNDTSGFFVAVLERLEP